MMMMMMMIVFDPFWSSPAASYTYVDKSSLLKLKLKTNNFITWNKIKTWIFKYAYIIIYFFSLSYFSILLN